MGQSTINNNSMLDTNKDSELLPPMEYNKIAMENPLDVVRATQNTPNSVEETTTNAQSPDINTSEEPLPATLHETVVSNERLNEPSKTTATLNEKTYTDGYTNNNAAPSGKNLSRPNEGLLKRQYTAEKPTNSVSGVPISDTRRYNCPNYAECEKHSFKPCIKCKKCGIMVGCFYDHYDAIERKKYQYCPACYVTAKFVNE